MLWLWKDLWITLATNFIWNENKKSIIDGIGLSYIHGDRFEIEWFFKKDEMEFV